MLERFYLHHKAPPSEGWFLAVGSLLADWWISCLELFTSKLYEHFQICERRVRFILSSLNTMRYSIFLFFFAFLGCSNTQVCDGRLNGTWRSNREESFADEHWLSVGLGQLPSSRLVSSSPISQRRPYQELQKACNEIRKCRLFRSDQQRIYSPRLSNSVVVKTNVTASKAAKSTIPSRGVMFPFS